MSLAEAVVAAGQHLANDFGWPVMPVKSHGKAPLTPHGVKDATTDVRSILHWPDRYGDDFNLGVACGAPFGPDVLDIDDMHQAAFMLPVLRNDATPESATGRGEQLFYAGTTRGTISLGFGELRSVGSYVVVPPSIHPNGKEYVWLNEPRSRALPPVPASVIADKVSAGVGELPERAGKVGHGERHDHLKDVAVRLLRGGITDVPTLAHLLRGEYEVNCEHDPPARADEFQKLAEWAAHTRMASRERNRAEHAEHAERVEPAPASLAPPREGASTAEHLAYIARVAGLSATVEIKAVRRFGTRLVDGLEIALSTGQVIDFARAGDALARGGWHKAVIGATEGAARPPGLKDPQLLDLWRSLCTVAHTSHYQTEAESHAETLREFMALTEPVVGYELTTAATRFRLIDALRLRERWDPFDRSAMASPAEITDERDGTHYLRGGELADWFRFKGAGLGTSQFPGRMTMVGLEQRRVSGREPMPLDPAQRRRTAHAVLYRVVEEP